MNSTPFLNYFVLILVLISGSTSWSASGITYHGRIIKPNNDPLQSATTRFRVQIKSPNAENCVLWEEEQTQNMLGSNGIFTITIGDSTNTLINYTRVDSYGWGMERVFSNRSQFTGLTGCTVGSTYNPSAADGRILEVSFKEVATDPTWEAFPATKINLIPMSLNTLQFEGYRADEFLKIDPYTNQTPLTNANVNTLLGLIAGTSNLYVKPADALGGDLSGTIGAGTVVGIRGRAVTATVPTVGQVLKFDGTSWVPSADDTGGATADASYAAKGVVQFDTNLATSGISVTAGVASLPNTITAGGPTGGASVVPVITYDAKGRLTAVSTAAVNDTTKLPLAGGTMTGSVNMGLQNITNATSVAATNFSGRNLLLSDNDTNVATIRAPVNLVADYALTLPTAAPTNGYVLSTDGTGQLSWIAAATGSVTSVGATSPILSSGGATPTISLDTGLGVSKVPQVGGTALGANGVIVANGTATALTSLNCSVNQVIKFDASGFATCGADNTGAANAFVQNGNAFGAAATLGTNDNFDLNFEANNTTRMTVNAATGYVGIGTTSPQVSLHVEGDGALINDVATGLNLYADNSTSKSFIDSIDINTGIFKTLQLNSNIFDVQTSVPDGSTLASRLFINQTGNVGIGTSSPATKLDVSGAVRIGNDATACAAGLSGSLRYNGSAVEYCNGSAWQAFGVSGAGLTSLNAQTGSTQTFASGATGTAPAFVSATNTHTLNIPLASGAGVTSGTISKTDYDNFNNKIAPTSGTSGGIPYFNSSTTMASSAALTANGVVLGGGAGATPVATAAGTNNQVFRVPAVGGAPAFGSIDLSSSAVVGTSLLPIANGGTNSSAALTNGKVMVSSAGSIIEGNASNTAKSNNTFVMRDGSGNIAGALGTFDQLALNGSVSGTLNIYPPSTFTSWNMTLPTSAGSNGQVLSTDGSGVTSWITALTSTSGFLNGGNSFGANANLGTNDNFDLNFKTNNTTKMTVQAGGNVGIGTTSPTSNLEVQGADTSKTVMTLLTNSDGSAAYSELWMRRSDGTKAAPTYPEDAMALGRVRFNNQAGTNGGAVIQSVAVGDHSATEAGANLSFRTTPSGSNTDVERLIIKDDGNVGIGTTTPSEALSVIGNFNISNTGNTKGFRFRTSGSTLDMEASGTNMAHSVFSGADYTGTQRHYLRFLSASHSALSVGEWNFKTGTDILAGNSIFYIGGGAGGGNVGIGTTSPGAKLDVQATHGAIAAATSVSTQSISSSASAAAGTSTYKGLSINQSATGASSFSEVLGAQSNISYAVTSGSSGNLVSFDSNSILSGNGFIGLGYGYRSRFQSSNGGVVGDLRHFAAESPSVTSGPGIANAMGLYISAQKVSGVGNGYGVYQTGSADINYFNGNVGIGTSGPNTSLDIAGAFSQRGMAAPPVSVAGQGRIYYSTAENKFKVSQNNGAYVDLVNTSSGGITSLGGQTGTTQTFANGATGTAPAFVSATNTHTLNIPLAAGAGVTSGTISKTEYDNFTAKLTSPLTTKGDLLSRDGSAHVRLAVGSNSQVLKANSATASGLEWAGISATTDLTGVLPIANGGTNSSTALTDGKVMVSSAGSIVEGVASNTAKSNNTFVMRDGSGNIAGALGTFDQIALPGLTSGILNIISPAVTANWTMTLPASAGTSGQVLSTNGSGVTSWTTALTSSTGFLNGGNSFGAAAAIGTNDNYALNFKMNNTTYMSLNTGGGLDISGTNFNAASFLSIGASTKDTSTNASAIGNAIHISTPQSVGQENGIAFTNAITYAAINGYTSDLTSYGRGGLKFKTSSTAGGLTTRMTIMDSGNVGIGTTSPGAQLQTNTSAIGTIGQIIKWGQAGQTANLLEFQNNSGTILSRVDKDGKFYGDGSGLTGITATPSGIAGSVQFSNGTALASDNSNLFWDDTNNRLGIGTSTFGAGFSTLAVNGSLAVGTYASAGIGQTNSLGVSGNIGAGRSNPTYKIDTYSSGGTASIFRFEGQNNSEGVFISGATSSANMIYQQGASTTFNIGHTNTGIGQIRAANNKDFQLLDTAATPWLYLKNGGNVGIGTTTPTGTLDVRGGTTTSSNGSNITFVTQAGTSRAGDISLSGATAPDFGGSLILSGGTSSNFGGAVNLSAGSGNFGGAINLTAGAAAGSNSTPGVVTILGGASGGNLVGGAVNITGGPGGANGNTAGGNIVIRGGVPGGIGTTYGSIVLADNGGNVGIGVASPQAALDVVSTGTSSAVIVPRATTGNRPTTLVDGMIRYNTTTALFEFYQNGGWVNYTTVSDGRLKTNVTPINQGLEIINQLNPVFFDWDQNNPRAQGFGTQHQVGFIAQEVEKVLPEVVNKGKDSYRSVEYGKIVSVVVAAVKELYRKVVGLEAQNANQDRAIASKADKTEVDQLKAENAAKDQKIKELEQRLERIEKSLKN